MVEGAGGAGLFAHPMRPYTRALLAAVPVPIRRRKRDRITLEGDVPSPINPPSGCHFRTRCPLAQEICKTEPAFEQKRPNHWVACHFAEKALEVLPQPDETIASN